MRSLVSLIPFLTILFAGAASCVDLPADDASAPVGTTEQALIECDTWVCGSNSPVISGLHFHELNTRGLANAEGFSVLGLVQGALGYQLVVEGGRIYGRSGSLQISGQELVGSQIWLRLGAKAFAIRITAVGNVKTFARLAGVQGTLETYQLDTTELVGGTAGDWRNLCSNPPRRDNLDVMGMNTAHVVVFEGERIDKVTKTISPELDTSWFNIGCTGHALAKLAANGFTESAKVFGFTSSITSRQAFLRMLIADYCGTGRPFTISGQPLQWMDSRGYTQYTLSPANLELEARWTANGAACINTPRVIANPSLLAQQTLGNNVAWDILVECGWVPPACGGLVTDLDRALVASANP